MRNIKSVMLAGLMLPWLLLTSCNSDLGNYDYDWMPRMSVEIEEIEDSDGGVILRGEVLTLTPKVYENIFDPTGREVVETVEITNLDDFEFTWYAVRAGQTRRDSRPLSTKRDFGEGITSLPIGASTRHRIELEVRNPHTGMVATTYFGLGVIIDYTSAYLFLTEDGGGNVELEMYATKADGSEELVTNVLEVSGFPYTTGGANDVRYTHDWRMSRRLWIATGSGVSWIDPITLAWSELNDLATVMAPPVPTFSRMIRGGNNSIGESFQFVSYAFFTPEGTVHGMKSDVINPNAAYVSSAPIQVAQMAGIDENACVLWDETNKQLVWWGSGGMQGPAGLMRVFTGNGQAPAGSECIYLGNSRSRNKKLIAVVKTLEGEYLKKEYATSYMGMIDWAGEASFRKSITLNNTAALGRIDHWVSVLKNGDLYCMVGNKMYTYREQVQDQTLSVWTEVEFYDTEDNVINMTFNNVTFMQSEDFSHKSSTTHPLYEAFYVVETDPSGGSKLHVFQSHPSNESIKLIHYKTIETPSNIKRLGYWGQL